MHSTAHRQHDDSALEPLDVTLRPPFSPIETPTPTTASLPTPQRDHPLLSGDAYDLSSPSSHHPQSPRPLVTYIAQWDDLSSLPPPPPFMKDMDSFGEGSAKGSFDFSLRSASSTEQLARSFSSLMSHSQPARHREVVTPDPPSASSRMLDSITESSLEGSYEYSRPSSIDDVSHPIPLKPRSLSVAFSPEDPCRSIEIWREDVLTSISDGSAPRRVESPCESIMGPSALALPSLFPRVEPKEMRVLKRHASALSDDPEIEHRRRQMRYRRPILAARVSTYASAGSSNGSVRDSATPEMDPMILGDTMVTPTREAPSCRGLAMPSQTLPSL